MERIIQRNGKWYKGLLRCINAGLYTVTTFDILDNGKMNHRYNERVEFKDYTEAKNYMEEL